MVRISKRGGRVMRGKRASRSVFLIVVVVAAIGIQARPAFAVDPPTTTPTITAPTDLSLIAGDIILTASSTAPTVQFLEYGIAIGPPVAVVGGVASTTFSTWGWPNQTIV